MTFKPKISPKNWKILKNSENRTKILDSSANIFKRLYETAPDHHCKKPKISARQKGA